MTNIPSGSALVSTVFEVTGWSYPAVVTFGLSAPAPFAAADFVAAWRNGVLNGGTSSYVCDPANMSADAKVTKVSALLNRAGVMTYAENLADIVGTGSWDGPAPNNAMLMRKRTGLAGRAFRGRCYWPAIFISATDMDTGGNMTGSRYTSWASNVAGIISKCAAQSVTPVLLHADGSAATTITATEGEALMATQRRRMRR